MKQRGRKSPAAAAVKPSSDRLSPRNGLSPDVAAVFGEIVSAVPASHFRESDAPLVEQYAQSILLARQAFKKLQREGPVVDGRLNQWVTVLEKSHRSSVALSMRLRLAPQHRVDPKTVGRAANVAPSFYEMHAGDDE